MSERPILMSGPEVRVILAGTKSQVRRVYRARRPNPYEIIGESDAGEPWPFEMDEAGDYHAVSSPCGAPGDRLWVRETWGFSASVSTNGHPRWLREQITTYLVYRADDARAAVWRPSIYMPRWASRLTLEVTEVRVQRLQDISEEDIEVEGVHCPRCKGVGYERLAESFDNCREPNCGDTARPWFADLWDDINGKRAPWASNPLVWAISFKRAA